jgi:hypothetical protein
MTSSLQAKAIRSLERLKCPCSGLLYLATTAMVNQYNEWNEHILSQYHSQRNGIQSSIWSQLGTKH